MELTIIKMNGEAYTDSREVAEIIGKRHSDLLRDIEKYRKYMQKIIERKIAFNDFFVESSYTDRIGRTLPCYLISKMGCEMIANKLTGEKGILFTALYVSKFNAMEAAEKQRETAMKNTPRLVEFNAAVRNVLNGMSYNHASPERIMNFLRGVYNPLGIAVVDECNTNAYFTPTTIARILGIRSMTEKPHGRAVAAIISKLNIPESSIVAIPYGMVGVTFRYTYDVVEAVANWLIDNGRPYEVPYLNFYYHIYYCRYDLEKRLEMNRRCDFDVDYDSEYFYDDDDDYDDFYDYDEDDYYTPHDEWLQGKLI